MRVTAQTVSFQVNDGLQRAYQQLARAQEVVASGRRINRLSDDPLGAVRVVELRSFEASVAQFIRNIDNAKPSLEQSEAVLGDVVEQLTRAREIALQVGNAVYSPAERAAAAHEVDQILEHSILLANTKIDNRFLFGGYKNATAPFRQTSAGVKYAGDGGEIQIQTTASSTLQVNFLGHEVFEAAGVPGGQGVFDILEDLASLLHGRNLSNTVHMQVSLDQTITPGGGFSTIDAVGAEIPSTTLLAEAAFSTSVTVFDANGTGHDLIFAFAKTTANTYNYRVLTNATDIIGGTPGSLYQVAPEGVLAFDSNGYFDATGSSLTDITMVGLSNAAPDITIAGSDLSFAESRQAAQSSAVVSLQQSNAKGFGAQLGRIDAVIDHILRYRTEAGARLNAAELTRETLDALRVRTIEERSRFEDADVLSAYSEFSRLQSAFEAALASASQVLSPSLLDFLR
jgi:flagellar hook-associated protein 3 FlgL